MNNITAFTDGVSARIHDDETGDLTDNPYDPGTGSSEDWYRGYNDETKTKEIIIMEIKLPVPVRDLAAVADALCEIHGTGKLFFRQVGQMMRIYKPQPKQL